MAILHISASRGPVRLGVSMDLCPKRDFCAETGYNLEEKIAQQPRESGGIGRRTRLRIWRVKPWGFKSPLSHQQFRTDFTMKSFPLLALLISLAACSNSCGSSSSVAGGGGGGANCNFQTGGDCSIIVNGVTRKFLLHIPANFQPNKSALVVALHGSQGDGMQMQTQSQLSVKADSVGFAVAYPTGLPSAQGHTLWSVYFNDFAFAGTPPDDVAFLRAMISAIQANVHPDAKKIYVAGFSIGGYMTHRAAVELSDLVAAVGVVEGAISAIAPSDSRTVPTVVAPVSK